MCYFDVNLLSDVISSIGPKISDADTYWDNMRMCDAHEMFKQTTQIFKKNVCTYKVHIL